MGSRVTKQQLSWRLCFRLSDKALERFWQILTDLGVMKSDATLTASDGSKLEFDAVRDVALFPNAPDRSIEKLVVSGYLDPKGFTSNLVAGFECDASGKNVRLLLEGSDEWVLRARRDIEEWVRANRTSYAPIAELDWFVAVLSVGLSVSLWATAIFLHGVGASTFVLSKPFAIGWVAGMAGGLLLAALFVWARRGFRYLFPLGVFTFGVHGEEREQRRAWWRMTVGGTVALGLVVNLIAAALYGWAQ